MKFHLEARWYVPNTDYELQQIIGSDGSVWVRIGTESGLLAVFSATKQGSGAMPTERVVSVLAEAATAHNPRVIVNALRFLDWEFWPATPAPLRSYLGESFANEVTQIEALSAFGRSAL